MKINSPNQFAKYHFLDSCHLYSISYANVTCKSILGFIEILNIKQNKKKCTSRVYWSLPKCLVMKSIIWFWGCVSEEFRAMFLFFKLKFVYFTRLIIYMAETCLKFIKNDDRTPFFILLLYPNWCQLEKLTLF